MNDLRPGTLVGPYRVERLLAYGGMGAVYVATRSSDGLRCALKILYPQVAQDPANVERFLREANVAARIAHEGALVIHDAGKDEKLGLPYLAMELLEGESFCTWLEGKERPVADGLTIIAEMLGPLEVAHAAGVVHRDLKPDNVFLHRAADGRRIVKLIDFGIARAHGNSNSTRTNTGLGTISYMSPEQGSNAKAVTTASDVWSIGVMLYEVVSGRLPFEGTAPHEVLIRAMTEPAAPLTTTAPWVDPRLAAFIDRCLAKQPSARPRDACHARNELLALLGDAAVRASLVGRTVKVEPFDADAPASVTRVPADEVTATDDNRARIGTAPTMASDSFSLGSIIVTAPGAVDVPASSAAGARAPGAPTLSPVVQPATPTRSGSRSSGPWIAVAAVALLVVGGGIGYVVLGAGTAGMPASGGMPVAPSEPARPPSHADAVEAPVRPAADVGAPSPEAVTPTSPAMPPAPSASADPAGAAATPDPGVSDESRVRSRRRRQTGTNDETAPGATSAAEPVVAAVPTAAPVPPSAPAAPVPAAPVAPRPIATAPVATPARPAAPVAAPVARPVRPARPATPAPRPRPAENPDFVTF